MRQSGKATLLRQFAADERGASAIEYALMASFIGAALAATIWTLGSEVKQSLYDKIAAVF